MRMCPNHPSAPSATCGYRQPQFSSVAVSLVTFFLLAASAQAAVLNVPRQYPTIEAAISASQDGDVIEIAAGTYAPSATLSTGGKAITIRGAVGADGSPLTEVDGQNVRRVIQCDTNEGANTRFENLVITRGTASNGGGMYLSYSSPTLTNCPLPNWIRMSNSSVWGCRHWSTSRLRQNRKTYPSPNWLRISNSSAWGWSRTDTFRRRWRQSWKTCS